MKIIAVNIKKTIKDIGLEKATQRAWKLNKSNAEKRNFVIGFNKIGHEYEYHCFALLNVEQDHEHEDRVKFNLRECTKTEREQIVKYVENENFQYVTVKYPK